MACLHSILLLAGRSFVVQSIATVLRSGVNTSGCIDCPRLCGIAGVEGTGGERQRENTRPGTRCKTVEIHKRLPFPVAPQRLPTETDYMWKGEAIGHDLTIAVKPTDPYYKPGQYFVRAPPQPLSPISTTSNRKTHGGFTLTIMRTLRVRARPHMPEPEMAQARPNTVLTNSSGGLRWACVQAS